MDQIELPHDFREFLRLLAEHDVEFLLVGGYAVAHHGYPRATQDLDLWVGTNDRNVGQLLVVLRAFGFTGDEVSPGLFDPGNIVRMGNPPMRLELLTELSGLRFEAARRHATMVDMDGVEVPVIGLDDLKANKRAAGRAKDLADLENLP